MSKANNNKAVVIAEHADEIGVTEPIAADAKTSWSAYTPVWLWSVSAYAKYQHAIVLAVLPRKFG